MKIVSTVESIKMASVYYFELMFGGDVMTNNITVAFDAVRRPVT